jgi:hypothetical protein
MPDPRVTIDEIVLRVPNLSEDDARRLGREVAERVGEALGRMLSEEPASVDLGGLDLRMTVTDTTSRERLTEAIAARIIASLRPALRGVQGAP